MLKWYGLFLILWGLILSAFTILGPIAIIAGFLFLTASMQVKKEICQKHEWDNNLKCVKCGYNARK